MDLPETRVLLTLVRQYDDRTIDDRLVANWQRALTRIPIEHGLDAVETHYDRCALAHTVPLTPPEVLHHVQVERERAADEERERRNRERNETVFGELQDHRTDEQRQQALAARRQGRAELDAKLAAIRASRTDEDEARSA